MKRSRPDRSIPRLLLLVLLPAALATKVIPVISSGPVDPKRDMALEDCERIRAAVHEYVADTGRLPGALPGEVPVGWLLGEGTPPRPADGAAGPGSALALRSFLDGGDARSCGPFWDGPYVMRLGPDPWGHAYVMTTVRREEGPVTWILSAGRDGVLDTHSPASRPFGDDVGVSLP